MIDENHLEVFVVGKLYLKLKKRYQHRRFSVFNFVFFSYSILAHYFICLLHRKISHCFALLFRVRTCKDLCQNVQSIELQQFKLFLLRFSCVYVFIVLLLLLLILIITRENRMIFLQYNEKKHVFF